MAVTAAADVFALAGPMSWREAPMKSIRQMLKGGDLRSIGNSDAVAKRVLRNSELIPELFALLSDGDRLVRMRAADALEKATRIHPEWLQQFKPALLYRVAKREEKELRWHVAQLLPRLRLSAVEKEQAVRVLTGYLGDSSRIVKTFSMQALADLAADDEQLKAEMRPLIARLTRTGTPAMRSRGRKLLKQLGNRRDLNSHAWLSERLRGVAISGVYALETIFPKRAPPKAT